MLKKPRFITEYQFFQALTELPFIEKIYYSGPKHVATLKNAPISTLQLYALTQLNVTGLLSKTLLTQRIPSLKLTAFGSIHCPTQSSAKKLKKTIEPFLQGITMADLRWQQSLAQRYTLSNTREKL